MIEKSEMELGGRTLSIETGRVAKQANGSAWLRYGDTIVLVATVASDKENANLPFFALTVDYREKFYAGGKIPGNFFKREGRPSTSETLHARLIDHSIRPLFPLTKVETQVYVTVLSFDNENDPSVLALNGASAAIMLSDIPFQGPIGAVRMGRIDGEFVVNPTNSQMEESDINMVLTGTADSIIGVEGEFHEVNDDDVLKAFEVGHEAIKEVIVFQTELVERAGKPKREVIEAERDEELAKVVADLATDRIKEANRLPVKEDRATTLSLLKDEVQEKLAEAHPEREGEISEEIYQITKEDMRSMILDEKTRIDGRALDEVRPISIDLGVLPRAHGSAIFTRGQTQALCATTLGSKMDTRMVDDLEGKSFKSFMLDYNFPSYSVGEVRRPSGPGRREIGHGALAEKAIEPVVPAEDHFPYTIRVVSEILEANSSSSMASVCGGSLALMDAGVPIKTPAAGAGVGLVMDDERWEVLTDILGEEDHLGDMDLKITGTKDGLTGVQMDIKIGGVSFEILQVAFDRARGALNHVLGKMEEAIASPREALSEFAPRILSIRIDPSKIGIVIGPGGKMIRSIEELGVTVSVEDDGLITVTSVDASAGEEAMGVIRSLVEDPEVGKVYSGAVKRVTDFGAFIEILPGKDGLCHISELEHYRVRKVEDVLKEGDQAEVKVIGIDDQGKIRLSRKVLLDPPEEGEGESPSPEKGSRRGGRRGGS
ncbi:MAG: polyribonucleotide nucleotidyltransferase [Gemmatimonadetes bacterium]|nr:polyribonucleotide nucleotidyltransferase [Gemmatimonadota bacterium]HCK08557.1 polyribonucleotide nucleotidyltransferase [Candidatus Latescibacterota bacterium]